MIKHECKYWNYNRSWHYRICTFCGKMQYNYGGEWKDEIKGLNFLDDYMACGSTDYSPQIEIDVDKPFEYGGHYENWNIFFRIKIQGKWYGPFDNFNEAESYLRKNSIENKKEYYGVRRLLKELNI